VGLPLNIPDHRARDSPFGGHVSLPKPKPKPHQSEIVTCQGLRVVLH
jgi:hypothetical protein